ncbi:ANKK1, partial [Symbiodinium sp. KB8]
EGQIRLPLSQQSWSFRRADVARRGGRGAAIHHACQVAVQIAPSPGAPRFCFGSLAHMQPDCRSFSSELAAGHPSKLMLQSSQCLPADVSGMAAEQMAARVRVADAIGHEIFLHISGIAY